MGGRALGLPFSVGPYGRASFGSSVLCGLAVLFEVSCDDLKKAAKASRTLTRGGHQSKTIHDLHLRVCRLLGSDAINGTDRLEGGGLPEGFQVDEDSLQESDSGKIDSQQVESLDNSFVEESGQATDMLPSSDSSSSCRGDKRLNEINEHEPRRRKTMRVNNKSAKKLLSVQDKRPIRNFDTDVMCEYCGHALRVKDSTRQFVEKELELKEQELRLREDELQIKKEKNNILQTIATAMQRLAGM